MIKKIGVMKKFQRIIIIIVNLFLKFQFSIFVGGEVLAGTFLFPND